MKAIILAAGYATRLYPLTKNMPKALLEVSGKTILDHIVEELDAIENIDEIFIITNHRFYGHFCRWMESASCTKPIKVIDDGTSNEEGRLGAIGDMQLVIRMEGIQDDILVVAGDNLFTFPLLNFYRFFSTLDKDCICVQRLEKQNDLKMMAVALVDDQGKVLDLEEKPANPKSDIAAVAIYAYCKETLPLIDEYLQSGNNPDAPGYFPSWLHKRRDVYAYFFEGQCYDIGTPESYKQVQELYEAKCRQNA